MTSTETQTRYLVYSCRNEIVTGINHQLFNLFALLAEASVLDRVAVVSPLNLAAWHNNGKPVTVHFSRYLDLTDCARLVSFVGVDDFHGLHGQTPVPEDAPTSELKGNSSTVIVRHFQRASFLRPMAADTTIGEAFHRIRALARPSADVCRHADDIARRLGDFNIVHVRRGDMLVEDWWRFPGVDRGTRPKAIRQRLRRWIDDGSTLYIMSDEPDPRFFDPLRTWYDVHTYRDFQSLVALKNDDNYLLYELEKHLATKAHVRVEMFTEYPQYGKFEHTLFDYPRGGTTSPAYRAIGKLINTADVVKRTLLRRA